jgi:hypothetical protein
VSETRAKSEETATEVAGTDALPVFARRFVQARQQAGLTLEQVAVAADIDDPACRIAIWRRPSFVPRAYSGASDSPGGGGSPLKLSLQRGCALESRSNASKK